MNEKKVWDEFVKISPDFFVRREFVDCFKKIGLKSMDDVSSFSGGKNLTKDNLAAFRQRIMFDTDNPKTTLFLKRYQNIPKLIQLKNWITRAKRLSMMACDLKPSQNLKSSGISTPKVIAYGENWNGFFENRSFIVTEKIPGSASLEEKLPESFRKNRKKFIKNLAAFIRKFHDTGFRHRDLYLCHIFCDSKGQLTLIDLNRVFKPLFCTRKYLIKDLAELYYSSPKIIGRTDRLRFFLNYLHKDKLSLKDKILIKKIKSKTQKMARHDKKHGRAAPFESVE